MTGPRIILPRPCPQCGEPFTPERRQLTEVHVNPVCCSKACANKLDGQRRKGRRIDAALAAKKAQAKARIEAITQKQFGPLSAREVRLFNYAAQVGYDRGYNAAKTQPRKHPRETQAA